MLSTEDVGRQAIPADTARAPQVSVVVPTYKRPELLARCLDALMDQDLDPAEYEIIIADDAASVETRRQVQTLAAGISTADPRLRYLPVQGLHGPAAARNAGWRVAQGEIIAFTDDDCVPAPDWLGAGLDALAEGVDGVSGQVVMPLPPDPTDYEKNATGITRSDFVTANCFYRRAVLREIGGFDERFTAAWREDSDLFFRLLEQGRRLVNAPAAVVVHPIRPARWGVSLSQQRKSMYNALLYKKHPQLYWRHIQPAPPWRYYAIVGAGLLALAGASRGATRPALAAAALWGVLTARFCADRLRGTSHAPRHVCEMIITSLLIPPLAVFWRLRGALKYRVFFV